VFPFYLWLDTPHQLAPRPVPRPEPSRCNLSFRQPLPYQLRIEPRIASLYTRNQALYSISPRCVLPPSLGQPNDRNCENLCPVHLHALEQCSASCTSFPTQYGSVTISSQAPSGVSQALCQVLSKACEGWGSGG